MQLFKHLSSLFVSELGRLSDVWGLCQPSDGRRECCAAVREEFFQWVGSPVANLANLADMADLGRSSDRGKKCLALSMFSGWSNDDLMFFPKSPIGAMDYSMNGWEMQFFHPPPRNELGRFEAHKGFSENCHTRCSSQEVVQKPRQ